MKVYRNIYTGERTKEMTPKMVERFFDNRCPYVWEVVE